MASYGNYDGWKLATPWDDGNGPCAQGHGWNACENPADEDCACRQCGRWFCPAHYVEACERCAGCAEDYEAEIQSAWDDVDYETACQEEALWAEHDRPAPATAATGKAA